MPKPKTEVDKETPEGLLDYGYWSPTEISAHLKKYKLIIFEWNALFHHSSGKALPGVADCLYLLNNFYIGQDNQPLKLCISRDCPPDARSEELVVRAEPTPEEWNSLNEVMNTKGSIHGPTFKRTTVCFAISSHVRKPSNIVIEYFKTEVGECENFYENKKVTRWPTTETLLVGATWRDFTTSSRSNVDFTWCSRFFGGLSGNSYWFRSSLLLDFEKKWFCWESAGTFNIQSKALVEIKWDNINYIPDELHVGDEYYTMALNLSLSANAMKQQILDELGLKNKFVGLSMMGLYFKEQNGSESWKEWPLEEGINATLNGDGDAFPVTLLLCTSTDSFPKTINTMKIDEFIIQNQEHKNQRYKESILRVKNVLHSKSTKWDIPNNIITPINHDKLDSEDDEGLRLGLMENNRQRDGINSLLRSGIIGYNLDSEYERYPELRKILVDIHSEIESNNTWALIVDDTHRGNLDLATSKVSYRYDLFKGEKLGVAKKAKKYRFGKHKGEQFKLHILALNLENGRKKIRIGFIAKEQREIAYRSLAFYFCKYPLLLKAKEIKESLKTINDEQTNSMNTITLDFIKNELNKELSAEGLGGKRRTGNPKVVLDDVDLSFKESVEKKINDKLHNKDNEYNFPVILKSSLDIDTEDSNAIPSPKKEIENVEYKSKTGEGKDNSEEKLKEATTFLSKGFWGFKHKRTKGNGIKRKFFFLDESKNVLYFSDKEVEGAEREAYTYNGKGIILGEITKIIHGHELDPKTKWIRHRKQCITIAGFFVGNYKTVNIEFDSTEACIQVYHFLHYLLFLNDDDTIQDNIIYNNKNLMEGKVSKIILGQSNILKNKYVKFDHGAITIYNLSGRELTGYPQHIFQVEHDTKVKTMDQDSSLHENEVKIEFNYGDLLVDGLFLKSEDVIFQCSSRKTRDEWYEKVATVAANLKVEKEANLKLLQHGKNRFYDDVEAFDPALRKSVTSYGGRWFG